MKRPYHLLCNHYVRLPDLAGPNLILFVLARLPIMFRLSPRPSDRSPRQLEPFTMDQRPTASDRKKKQWEVMVLNSIMILFCNTAIWMSRPPQNSIFEEIICEKELGDRKITAGDDDGCRGTAVQSELAFINGWKNTSDALPSRLALENCSSCPVINSCV